MNYENKSKSIALIGPSCVGKSLLAKQLGQKNNMKVINIDDLVSLVQHEMNGMLSPDKEVQNAFVEILLDGMLSNPDTAKNVVVSKYRDETMKLIYSYLDRYDGYKRIVEDFRPLYKVITDCNQLIRKCSTPEEQLMVLTNSTQKILDYILKNFNEPVILDLPAPYGWYLKGKELPYTSKYKLRKPPFNIKVSELQKDVSDLLSPTTSVLLVPGVDYAKRNAESNYEPNNVLLNNLDKYYANADIVINTNGLFNTPENPVFQERPIFDGYNSLKKNELLDKASLRNLCSEITDKIDELTLLRK